MKKNVKLALLLLSLLVNSGCSHAGSRGIDTTICSVFADEVVCSKAAQEDYKFKTSDKAAADLVCVPSMDWTMIQIEMHKE